MAGRQVRRSEPTLFTAAWKRKGIFTLVLLLALAGAVLVGFLSDSQSFGAQALLILRDPNTLETGGTSARFVSEQVEIMRSPIVAKAAAEKLAESHPDYQATADELLGVTSISSSPDSALVFLGVTDLEPQRAIDMVNAMAEAFQEVSRSEATQDKNSAVDRLDAELQSLDDRLNEVESEIESARNSDTELSQLRDQFREAMIMIADLQAQLPDASTDRAAVIRQSIADYQGRIQAYRDAQAAVGTSLDLAALQAEQDQLIVRRSDLLQRRDQLVVDVELEAGVVTLYDPAVEAVEFGSLGPGRVLAVGLVVGLLAAFGVTFLLDLRRRKFADRREPEVVLGVPLLADIPNFASENLESRLPVRDDPRSAAAESFRFAAASIEEAMRAQGLKSVMMVGATLGHGKTTCVVNTTMANARQGHSSLLIDGDFGNQDATRLVLGDRPLPALGLIEVVEDGVAYTEAVTPVALGTNVDLSLLSRGSRSSIAANLLSSNQAAAVFDSAGKDFDLVFVDAPPLLQVAYASTLASHVEALVVVVSHGSSVGELEELADRLELIDTPVLGYLYNRSPLRREMRASEGSMMDILGEGVVQSSSRGRSWWQSGS